MHAATWPCAADSVSVCQLWHGVFEYQATESLTRCQVKSRLRLTVQMCCPHAAQLCQRGLRKNHWLLCQAHHRQELQVR